MNLNEKEIRKKQIARLNAALQAVLEFKKELEVQEEKVETKEREISTTPRQTMYKTDKVEFTKTIYYQRLLERKKSKKRKKYKQKQKQKIKPTIVILYER